MLVEHCLHPVFDHLDSAVVAATVEVAKIGVVEFLHKTERAQCAGEGDSDAGHLLDDVNGVVLQHLFVDELPGVAVQAGNGEDRAWFSRIANSSTPTA